MARPTEAARKTIVDGMDELSVLDDAIAHVRATRNGIVAAIRPTFERLDRVETQLVDRIGEIRQRNMRLSQRGA